MYGRQFTSGSVFEFPSVSPSWMAVTGLQNTKCLLLSQAVMPASTNARSARAKSRALSAMSVMCALAMSRSAWLYTVRKFMLKNVARSVCSWVRSLLTSPPRRLTSL